MPASKRKQTQANASVDMPWNFAEWGPSSLVSAAATALTQGATAAALVASAAASFARDSASSAVQLLTATSVPLPLDSLARNPEQVQQLVNALGAIILFYNRMGSSTWEEIPLEERPAIAMQANLLYEYELDIKAHSIDVFLAWHKTASELLENMHRDDQLDIRLIDEAISICMEIYADDEGGAVEVKMEEADEGGAVEVKMEEADEGGAVEVKMEEADEGGAVEVKMED
jgi:hypothetical protein